MVLILVVYALAVARVTRLINADTILDGPRSWIVSREKHHRTTADGLEVDPTQPLLYATHRRAERRWQTALYFVQCPWCVGMWVALATAWVPLYFADNPIARYIGVGLAASHLVGVFAFAANTEDMDYEDEPVS